MKSREKTLIQCIIGVSKQKKMKKNPTWNSITKLKSVFEFDIFGLFNLQRLSFANVHWIIHLDRGVRTCKFHLSLNYQFRSYATTYLATVHVPLLLSSPLFSLFFGGIRFKPHEWKISIIIWIWNVIFFIFFFLFLFPGPVVKGVDISISERFLNETFRSCSQVMYILKIASTSMFR